MITFERIHATMNVGCSTCGQQSVQAVIDTVGGITEIVETQCMRHRESRFQVLPKLPCANLVCRDPECRRAHLCQTCGQDVDDCACGQDCTTGHDIWLDRSELT